MADCNRCGRCCGDLLGAASGCGISITLQDIERWSRVNHPALRWLDKTDALMDVWINPATGDEWQGHQCPWLRKNRDGTYRCGIYRMRPDTCREWQPTSEEQRTRIGCCMDIKGSRAEPV